MLAIAARAGSSQPVFVEAPEPRAPGPGEVLCRTFEVGVCGTDRDVLASGHPLLPPGEDHLILGHECLARVEEVGAGVDGPRPGDLVAPVVRRAKQPGGVRVDLLPLGAFTERGIVHEHGFARQWFLDRPEFLFPVAAEIAGVAVLTEPLSVAEKAVNEAVTLQRARLGDDTWTVPPPRVLVTGLGPIAFAAVLACRCREWPVTVLGREEETTFRAELAQSFGAAYLPTSRCEFEPANVEVDGFDLILECTGADEVMVRCASLLASCGAMAWLGSERAPRPAQRNVALMMRRGVVRNHLHLGSVNAAPRDFADALRHLAQLQRTHPQELASLITARVPPEEALWHYCHRAPQGIKTAVNYG
ncbi:MAG: alcohol dehydrogenase catalytic domain-containing protein [Planctomycetes bacterium]|nr:alcohol dehydrogenase catalytic domain-containing protein [Planctomycetota bacterium]